MNRLITDKEEVIANVELIRQMFTEFDERLWGSLVEKLVVRTKTDVTVVFKDGTEIKAE